MYYRYEARVLEDTPPESNSHSWSGIFQCFDPDQRRKWWCLSVPKWYLDNPYAKSTAWFTQYGFEKWHMKMLNTIYEFLDRYPYFEIRIIRAEKLCSIAIHGKIQCISQCETDEISYEIIQNITYENIDNIMKKE